MSDLPKAHTETDIALLFARNPEQHTDADIGAIIARFRSARTTFVAGGRKAPAKLTEKEKAAPQIEIDLKDLF